MASLGQWWRDWFREAAALDVAAVKERATPAPQVPSRYDLAERPLTCAHCAGATFLAKSVNLHSNMQALLNVEWLGASVTALECEGCGVILFLARPPTRKDPL